MTASRELQPPTVKHRSSLADRRLLSVRRLAASALIALLAAGAVRAAEYTANVTVTDIDDRPLAGIQVAVGSIKKDLLKTDVRAEEVGTTDSAGQVTVKLSTDASTVGATVIGEEPGRIHQPADLIARLAKGTNQVAFQLLTVPDDTRMAAGGTAEARGYFGETGSGAYPSLETQPFTLDDSPLHLWRAYGGATGRPVLLVQGLFLTTERPTTMQVFGQAFDLVQALRRAGRDVWVLAFADPFAPLAAQALAVSDAVRTASEAASGAKVDVVGLSVGGLAARYALARDEATGGPSDGKVGVFAAVDTPHQGANIHVGIQAALWVAGGAPGDRIMRSPGVQSALYQWVGKTNFEQDQCRFPRNGSIKTTPAAHDAFSAELAALNGDGYPHKTRNVAVAASAPTPRAQKVGDVAYHLKASLKVVIGRVGLCGEDYKARAEDVLPGSTFPGAVLPESYEDGPVLVELDRRFDPTFVPHASALDLKDSPSPFAATFAAKEGLLVHGAFPEGAVPFLVEQLAAGSSG